MERDIENGEVEKGGGGGGGYHIVSCQCVKRDIKKGVGRTI